MAIFARHFLTARRPTRGRLLPAGFPPERRLKTFKLVGREFRKARGSLQPIAGPPVLSQERGARVVASAHEAVESPP